jgi:hypothetical protein
MANPARAEKTTEAVSRCFCTRVYSAKVTIMWLTRRQLWTTMPFMNGRCGAPQRDHYRSCGQWTISFDADEDSPKLTVRLSRSRSS